ncbi:MAG: DUF1667 domain-containing protein [Lachnospiraceae bacterium]|nr:DUF1667 domain-containing protein [Lachnospiraceae bacterium]
MKREMVCIGCPMGCQLSAELTEAGVFVSVTGNTCKRGAEYARTECTDPRRTLTTTLRCVDGGVVAVKTEQPIPKDRLMEAMKQLNQVVVPLPVTIGDVLIPDVFGSRVVACQNRL